MTKLSKKEASELFNAMETSKEARDELYRKAIKNAHGDTCADYLESICAERFKTSLGFEFRLPAGKMLPYWCSIGFEVMAERGYCITHKASNKWQSWTILRGKKETPVELTVDG